jgi:hypothetical protein
MLSGELVHAAKSRHARNVGQTQFPAPQPTSESWPSASDSQSYGCQSDQPQTRDGRIRICRDPRATAFMARQCRGSRWIFRIGDATGSGAADQLVDVPERARNSASHRRT